MKLFAKLNNSIEDKHMTINIEKNNDENTLYEYIEEHVQSSCCQGICGGCKVTILTGTVNDFSNQPKKSKVVLACACRAKSDCL